MTGRELRRLLFDVRAARAVLAALELGVFEALAGGPASVPELAEATGLGEEPLALLLEALAALGLLERRGRGFALAPGTREFVPSAADTAGTGGGRRASAALHDLWQWGRWTVLARILREGPGTHALGGDPYLGDPEVLKRLPGVYVEAMDATLDGAETAIAELALTRPWRTVLDLGGGSGRILAALLERRPDARGILVDRPFVLAEARARLERRGLHERVAFEARDLERDPLPRGGELAVLARVLMGYPAERAEAIVRRASEVLAPGGALLVYEYDPRSRVGALLSLDVWTQTGGRVHGLEATDAWCARAGLVRIAHRRVRPYAFAALYARSDDGRGAAPHGEGGA